MSQSNPAAQTAFGPIAITAIEQHEPPASRIVTDDLAASFLSGARRWLVRATAWGPFRRGVIALGERSGQGAWSIFVCRKRYIDDQLAAVAGQFGALVDLGAGLDTRGCRLAQSSRVPVFEVDQPINSERKKLVIERALGAVPRSVHLVPVDFSRDDLAASLQQAGYDPVEPSFFIWEGVTQYIPESAVRSTLGFLAGAAPGSRITFTYVERNFLDGTNLYNNKILYNKMIRSGVWMFGLMPDEVAPLLAEYGWRVLEDVSGNDFQDRYLGPAGRRLAVTQLEHTVLAEKIG